MPIPLLSKKTWRNWGGLARSWLGSVWSWAHLRWYGYAISSCDDKSSTTRTSYKIDCLTVVIMITYSFSLLSYKTTHTHTHLHRQFMTKHGWWRIIQSYSHFIFKNSVLLLTCKENHFPKFVGNPTSKTWCREMHVLFQSIEGLSNECPNVTTPSSSVISGVMTLTCWIIMNSD